VFRTVSRAFVLAILSLGACVLGSGCGDDHGTAPGTRQPGQGSITVALLSGGVTVDAVAYTITGPNSFSQTGSLNVSTSSTMSALIGGLPGGMGYVIALAATGADGTTSSPARRTSPSRPTRSRRWRSG